MAICRLSQPLLSLPGTTTLCNVPAIPVEMMQTSSLVMSRTILLTIVTATSLLERLFPKLLLAEDVDVVGDVDAGELLLDEELFKLEMVLDAAGDVVAVRRTYTPQV